MMNALAHHWRCCRYAGEVLDIVWGVDSGADQNRGRWPVWTKTVKEFAIVMP
jgi:hypothetical protein